MQHTHKIPAQTEQFVWKKIAYGTGISDVNEQKTRMEMVKINSKNHNIVIACKRVATEFIMAEAE